MITEGQIQDAMICIDSPYADTRKQAIEVLERYEDNKWSDFAEFDESTHPRLGQEVFLLDYKGRTTLNTFTKPVEGTVAWYPAPEAPDRFK